ncbi:hypothetical protein [Oricola nitratireducens]|jgi:hypothetical protein|nr:hypothetical protein [Oricola nitratireducens]
MAKGQKRSNKEIRKPKQDKQAKAAVSAGAASPMKIIEAGGFTGKKK